MGDDGVMASHRPTRRTPRVPAAAVLAAAAVAALLGGCANSPGEVDPTGVDELTVPTPSPDPDDFVEGVDNDWYPLQPGSVRRWRVIGGSGGGLRVSVAREPLLVAGVESTVVRTRSTFDPRAVPDGWETEVQTDFYAQDRDGNVWWLGRAGEWEAGVDGAQAGLLVPAEPRLGDGYQMALLEGVVDVRAEVAAVEDDEVRLELVSMEGSEEVVLQRDVGPIRVESEDEALELLTDPVA